ncbi:MAG TPA: VWA domain-containing protein [Pyrinomonadaceae bacterium]|jgi:VWFA-related protein
MKMLSNYSIRFIFANLLCLLAFTLNAQTPTPGQEPAQTDDVLRINAELVQTAVSVMDRQGRFVEGLRAEQFELRVDGKPQSISFFERVRAGSNREAQLARRGGLNPASTPSADNQTSERGRTIIFFIDDLHLSLQSVDRTRRMLQHFIEQEMGAGDRVTIASASGQIGFLQQFTDNRAVLRAAVSRINHRPYILQGYLSSAIAMPEYMALLIDSQTDPRVFYSYVSACLQQTNMQALRATCELQVKNSAREILRQAGQVTSNTYESLESLMRYSQRMPGRKLAFFVSDGFLLDTGPHSNSLSARLQRITDAAQRAGVVIYTIDAKGLVSGSLDATNSIPIDTDGRFESASLSAVAASQDALMALADNTGGRALRNRNSFEDWITQALEETSNYYLLAWRPDTEEQKDQRFRKVEVIVKGRPDLTVRLPSGFINGSKFSKAASNPAVNSSEKPASRETASMPERVLNDVLAESETRGLLPTSLSVTYLNTPNNGMVLTASMQVAGSLLSYGPDEKQPAEVDVAGLVLNDKGKITSSFINHVSVKPLSGSPAQPDAGGIIYNYRTPLAPGIYQVRVASRDAKSGRVGNAIEWIEIPDLAQHQLTLSSLLIGVSDVETKESERAQTAPQVQFSVDHRFARNLHLNFLTFIYNAQRTANNQAPAELSARVEVLRGGQTVFSNPSQKVKVEGTADPARIPFSGVIPLERLGAGRYTLQVSVTDRATMTTASQRINFSVE